MTPEQRKKYGQLHWLVGEILLHDWDPIQVREHPEACDEYDSYVPQVISEMQGGGGVAEVAALLRKIEEERIEMSSARTQEAAEKCVEAWRAHGW